MKKEYFKPEIEIERIEIESSLMTVSSGGELEYDPNDKWDPSDEDDI